MTFYPNAGKLSVLPVAFDVELQADAGGLPEKYGDLSGLDLSADVLAKVEKCLRECCFESHVATRHARALIRFAFKLALEGHENSCIGTLLVFATDETEIKQFLQPMADAKHTRNDGSYFALHRDGDERSIINLVLGDGAAAFNARSEMCGCWLRVTTTGSSESCSCVGGTKHTSARALSAACSRQMFTVCVSESGGKVTLFHQGIAKVETGPLYRGVCAQDVVAKAVDETLRRVRPGSPLSTSSSSCDIQPSSLKFRLTFTQSLEPAHVEASFNTLKTFAEHWFLTKQVRHWLDDDKLQLEYVAEEAARWLWYRKLQVPDMVSETDLNMLALEMPLNEFLQRRLIRNGSAVASRYDMMRLKFPSESLCEIVIEVKGVFSFATFDDEMKMREEIVVDIERQCNYKVQCVRFSSIVVLGPLQVFFWLEKRLSCGMYTQIIGFPVTHVKCGQEVHVSFMDMPCGILDGMQSELVALMDDDRATQQIFHMMRDRMRSDQMAEFKPERSTIQEQEPTATAIAPRVVDPTTYEEFFKQSTYFAVPWLIFMTMLFVMRYVPWLQSYFVRNSMQPYGFGLATQLTVYSILCTYAMHGWIVVNHNMLMEKGLKILPNVPYNFQCDDASTRATLVLLFGMMTYAFVPMRMAQEWTWRDSIWEFVVGYLILLIGSDAWYFFVHFMAHKITLVIHGTSSPTLYRIIRKTYHKKKHPVPFSAYFKASFAHALDEHFFVVPAMMFLPVPWAAFCFYQCYKISALLLRHSGFDIHALFVPFCGCLKVRHIETICGLGLGCILGSQSIGGQDYHHETFGGNFQLFYTYLDKLYRREAFVVDRSVIEMATPAYRSETLLGASSVVEAATSSPRVWPTAVVEAATSSPRVWPTVGSKVLANGKAGEVLVYDAEDPDMAYKVIFSDGSTDWFREDDVWFEGTVPQRREVFGQTHFAPPAEFVPPVKFKPHGPTTYKEFFKVWKYFAVPWLIYMVLLCFMAQRLLPAYFSARGMQPYGLGPATQLTAYSILCAYAMHGWIAVNHNMLMVKGLKILPNVPYNFQCNDASTRATLVLLFGMMTYAFVPMRMAPASTWRYSILEFVCGYLILLIGSDAWYFFVHYMAHTPTFYRIIHKTYHLWKHPVPFSTYFKASFSHALDEHFFVIPAMMFLPVPCAAFCFYQCYKIPALLLRHSGFDIHALCVPFCGCLKVRHIETICGLGLGCILGSQTIGGQDYHHETFMGNFQLFYTYLDQLFGVYVDTSRKPRQLESLLAD